MVCRLASPCGRGLSNENSERHDRWRRQLYSLFTYCCDAVAASAGGHRVQSRNLARDRRRRGLNVSSVYISRLESLNASNHDNRRDVTCQCFPSSNTWRSAPIPNILWRITVRFSTSPMVTWYRQVLYCKCVRIISQRAVRNGENLM